MLASAALLTGLGYLEPIGQAALDIVGEVTGQVYDAAARPRCGWSPSSRPSSGSGCSGHRSWRPRTKGNGVVEDFGLRFRRIDVPSGW